MDGVIVVDKPRGVTSHDVVSVARRELGESRIGHTGTLDPLATGVLPLACGRATRLVRFLTASEKEYEATLRFGITTDSYDITGAETTRSGRGPDLAALEDALASFRGEHSQMPPAFSAKKVHGHRAYALARRNEAVELEPVRVRVSQLRLEAFAGTTATLVLVCSAGFYVRSFAHDLGQRVGTGACLEALRRTRSGQFAIGQAVTLDALQGGHAAGDALVPMNRLLTDLPAVSVTSEGRRLVTHGRDLDRSHLSEAVAAGLPDPSQGWDGHAGPAAPGRGPAVPAESPAATGWMRVFDEAGDLIALATPAGQQSLHPSVVLI